jgi:hypothetical protein
MLRHSLCPTIVDVKPGLLCYASSAALVWKKIAASDVVA